MRCGIEGCCGRATRIKGVEADGVDDTFDLNGRPGRERAKAGPLIIPENGKWVAVGT